MATYVCNEHFSSKLSLLNLPQDVLEIIFTYLEIRDLYAMCHVICFQGSEHFWKTLCRKEGYKNSSTEVRSWRKYFFHNFNWKIQNCVNREYNVDKMVKHQGFDYYYFERYHLSEENIVTVSNSASEISVWNVGETPNLVQQIPEQFLKISRNYILTKCEQLLKIYFCIDNTYYEMKSLEGFFSPRLDGHYALSDEYFAALDNTLTCFKVVKLINGDEIDIPVLPKTDFSFIQVIKILGNILYVVEYERSHYVLRKYDLYIRRWLDGIILCRGWAFMRFVFDVSFDILVCVHDHPTCPLKVWINSEGGFRSQALQFIFPCLQERVLWLIVKDDYLLTSTNEDNIVIWCSNNPNSCNRMFRNKEFYVGQDVVSNNLLVLSYRHCFRVVDFKNATYLYEVWFDNFLPKSNSHSLFEHYLVNEYFYIHVKEQNKLLKLTENSVLETNNVTSFINSSQPSTSVYVPCPVKSYGLKIYDFRTKY